MGGDDQGYYDYSFYVYPFLGESRISNNKRLGTIWLDRDGPSHVSPRGIFTTGTRLNEAPVAGNPGDPVVAAIGEAGLVIRAAIVDKAAVVGSPTKFQVTVENMGNSDSSQLSITSFLSHNNNFEEHNLLTTSTFDALAASYYASQTMEVPAISATGKYYYRVCVREHTSNTHTFNDCFTTPFRVLGWEQAKAHNTNDWGTREHHSSLVFQNKIWILGGAGNTSSDIWHSTDGEIWTEITSNAAWSGRQFHTSLVFEDKMWVLGGKQSSDNSILGDVFSSENGITWNKTNNHTFPNVASHSSLVFAGKMWVLGGQNESQKLNDVWHSNDGIAWTKVAAEEPIWQNRIGLSSVVFDNKIWVMGGIANNDSILNDIWYSEDGSFWTEVTASADWEARAYFKSAVLDNKLWVMYGLKGLGTTAENSLFDTWSSKNGSSWIKQSDTSFSALETAVFDNKIWGLGANHKSGIRTRNDVWRLTFENDSFSSALELNYNATGISGHSAVLKAADNTVTPQIPKEQDYYLINLPTDTYNFIASGDANINCSLYRGDRTEITKDDNGENCAIENQNLDANDYYILVEGADDDASGGYNLRIQPQE
jgi:hypothetical protein